ncbi:MAG: hypothetical protein K9H65_02845 [Bacteroidales bacterium]|nr:hypothetical protein [Bacteroidales bacterium]
MKTVLQIILAIVIIGLGYGLYKSIQTPIEFRQVKQQRYDATIQKLKNIRTAQLAYKDEYGTFTGSFDTLIDFVNNDSLRVVKAIGRIPDKMLEQGMTEQEALRKGIIERDTIRISVKDSLFGPDFNANLLWKVPYTNDTFQLGAKTVESGNVNVDVFEAKVHNDVLLHDQNEQLVINLNERMSKKQNKFPGVKVGDLEEPNNNAGNWE